LALAHLQKEYNIGCRVQLLGTPAEENGGGKAKLLDAGAYKEVDVSLMAYDHPSAPPLALKPGTFSPLIFFFFC
jgi:metal-dependent amidase/aminoacylase/carboxypeptidase family protein